MISLKFECFFTVLLCLLEFVYSPASVSKDVSLSVGFVSGSLYNSAGFVSVPSCCSLAWLNKIFLSRFKKKPIILSKKDKNVPSFS